MAVRPDDVRRLTRMNASSTGNVAPPGDVLPVGLPGPQAQRPFDPSTQPAGGLPGMIEDYMRNNSY
jgi:hypothetical protein